MTFSSKPNVGVTAICRRNGTSSYRSVLWGIVMPKSCSLFTKCRWFLHIMLHEMLMKGRVNTSYVFYVHPDEIEAITREFAASGNNLNQVPIGAIYIITTNSPRSRRETT